MYVHLVFCVQIVYVLNVCKRVKSDIGIRRYNAFIGIRNKLSTSCKFGKKSEI